MSKVKSNDLSGLSFSKVSSGAYRVTLTYDRGDYYSAIIRCMPLIDATKNAEIAKVNDIKALRRAVVRDGVHYSKNGVRIYDYGKD